MFGLTHRAELGTYTDASEIDHRIGGFLNRYRLAAKGGVFMRKRKS
jgi:hypothetical protein